MSLRALCKILPAQTSRLFISGCSIAKLFAQANYGRQQSETIILCPNKYGTYYIKRFKTDVFTRFRSE